MMGMVEMMGMLEMMAMGVGMMAMMGSSSHRVGRRRRGILRDERLRLGRSDPRPDLLRSRQHLRGR